MPIIRIELVVGEDEPEVEPSVVRALADELGDYLGSSVAETWVSLSYLPKSGYAENGVSETLSPTFAHLLRYQLPEPSQLSNDAKAIADIIARHLGRPRENIHIIFEPDAKGRIAFGGELVD